MAYLHKEPHAVSFSDKLNWLRAAVLGANDGIVSVASIVVGVAGVSNTNLFILTAGVAGTLAGALSMAAGEYVSVSTQRDTEKALIEKERRELLEQPEEELKELVELYKEKGLSEPTARAVAQELTEKDAFAAHADIELRIDPNNLTKPGQAAFASMVSFIVGAIIPLAIVMLTPPRSRIFFTFVGVILALSVTGYLSAKAGGAGKLRATTRVVGGGLIAMIVTFAVGTLLGASGI